MVELLISRNSNTIVVVVVVVLLVLVAAGWCWLRWCWWCSCCYHPGRQLPSLLTATAFAAPADAAATALAAAAAPPPPPTTTTTTTSSLYHRAFEVPTRAFTWPDSWETWARQLRLLRPSAAAKAFCPISLVTARVYTQVAIQYLDHMCVHICVYIYIYF